MKKFYFTILIITIFTGIMNSQNKIGQFDRLLNIGASQIAGTVSFNDILQTYTISHASPGSVSEESNFYYLWTTIQGDFILRAEAIFSGNGKNDNYSVGWLVKNDLRENSEFVKGLIRQNGDKGLEIKTTLTNNPENILLKEDFSTIIQLERKGDKFILSTSKFGEELKYIETEGDFINNEAYIGLFLSPGNFNTHGEVSFRNVRIIKPVDPDYQPYRDYIGSNLEVMDIETGHRKILYQSTHSIQAPNWSLDGKNLIYNSKGLLYEYSLYQNSIMPLNTGFANRNNNDHVISFDGKLLGISHHNNDDEGNSSLYYMSINGSNKPIKVTKDGVGASYLHGWSPDNKKMVFTGNRKEKYDIYSVDLETGLETQLTDESTLDDGPEYSPDGRYIFFNSSRSGKMQLWRMDPDGKNQVQLTFDEYNNWFPHISPDMKWIVYISFPKDINPNEHPFYKHCMIKLMPYEGGDSIVLADIYGGQGTINVPSWSPDSKKIAFVSNTKL